MTTALELNLSEFGFSRSVEAETLKHGKSQKTLKATKNECKTLKQRFDLLDLRHLSATLNIQRRGTGSHTNVIIKGHLDAEITQICVITLEPFNSVIKSKFASTFDARNFEELGDINLYLKIEDTPELIVDGIIDLGELISQNLALEINLHPRKPGATIDLSTTMMLSSSEIKNELSIKHPFAALQKLNIKSKD
jgi:uncharacterized metal-binding protein YceD (DUF177 family)